MRGEEREWKRTRKGKGKEREREREILPQQLDGM